MHKVFGMWEIFLMEVKSWILVGFTLWHPSENTLLIFKQIARVPSARKMKAVGTQTLYWASIVFWDTAPDISRATMEMPMSKGVNEVHGPIKLSYKFENFVLEVLSIIHPPPQCRAGQSWQLWQTKREKRSYWECFGKWKHAISWPLGTGWMCHLSLVIWKYHEEAER